jgi:Zn-dependent M16 (insulinase) family peptidase
MKARYIVLSLLASSTVIFAVVWPPYDNAKPPTLLLPAAYQMALTALGSSTNQFHCVSAKLSNDFGGPGWYFIFSSTNASTIDKRLDVQFDGKVIEDPGVR